MIGRIGQSMIALWLLLFLGEARSMDYIYVTPFSGEPVLIISADRGIVLVGGHLASEAKFCGSSDPNYCVTSRAFSFAVPRTGISEDEWTVDGFTYRRIGAGTTRLLGVPVEVIVIESQQDNVFTQFAYSATRGLIAVRDVVDGKASTLISAYERGFGAPSSDSVRNKK